MIERFETRVPAPGGEQTRTAYLYLPKRYDGKRRFPVLYMFDGQTAFFDETAPYGASWRMGETLDAFAADLIVAAVECDAQDRLTEYSPFPFASPFGSSEGKGDVYLDWLTGTFKPMIDRRYPTEADRAHTFVCGSSMGGLMTFYALAKYSAVFGGGAALSPSFWVDPDKCASFAEQIPKGTKLYLDYGENELKKHGKAQSEALGRTVSALLKRGIPFDFRLVAGGAHSETSWREQVPVFLRALGLI